MTQGRLEAFSDGVIAILITIMVLELRVPHGAGVEALRPLLPVALAYILSYVMLGIYWTNHHHMLHASERINGAILWANLHLLFWLSLIPVVTGWMGDNPRAAVPTAMYGGVLLLAAIAYMILSRAIIGEHGPDSRLARAIGHDFKGWLSIALYAVALPLAFLRPWIAQALFVVVAAMWLVPDRRIERHAAHA